jgi:subtilisin family serine protease
MFRRIISISLLASLCSAALSPLATFAAAARQGGDGQQARAGRSKLAPEFDSAAGSAETVRVIIQTKGRLTAAQETAVNSRGGASERRFEALDVMTAVVPRSALAGLAARDDIAYISPDRRVTGQMALTTEATGAAIAQAGGSGSPALTGKGVGIAVVDSGISAAHPDFQSNGKSRVVAAVDFTSEGAAGRDLSGHGTGVASAASRLST